ncbi:MAG: hypothetical protein WA192_00650 [Candidatus Acidiferrales bacterium]
MGAIDLKERMILARSVLSQIARMKMRGHPPTSIASVTGFPMAMVMEVLSAKVGPRSLGSTRMPAPPFSARFL